MGIKKEFIITIVLLLLFTNATLHADTITLMGDSWAPYNAEPNSNEEGYAIEVARIIFERNGLKVEYEIAPWNRSLLEIRAGGYTGIVGASKGDARDFVFPEEEIGITKNVFFVTNNSKWRYSGIQSLEKERLGVIADYSYGKELDEYIKANNNNENKVQKVRGEDALLQNIKKLQAGRISVLVEDKAVLEYRLKKMGILTGIVEAGAIEENPIYIAFTPKNPNSGLYAKMISDGIVGLRKSGKLREILKKYGLKDWKK